MSNRLADSTSPYLLQHADNPVDWHPWGEEAFAEARAANKLIFLSIGYSTCHWCHVMERESFENETIAALLNEHFINIKVDREERPDVDRVYMAFVQATAGGGGWPMSVWLTPALEPVVGGTYFPPDDRHGRAGFATVIKSIARAWREDGSQMSARARQSVVALGQAARENDGTNDALDFNATFAKAASQFLGAYDPEHGGLGDAPKFPRTTPFDLLLRHSIDAANGPSGGAAQQVVLESLRKMACGGIHDHLGGGFHRYSVDERWHVPHFEKMLYDQAQLALLYIDAWRISADEVFARTARGIFEYVLRDLTSAQGGFFSAEDADSRPVAGSIEEEEGAFHVWTRAEIESLLGGEARLFCDAYGVESGGNVSAASDPHGELDGQNVLYRRMSGATLARLHGLDEAEVETRLAAARGVLFVARTKRPRPHLDDKIIAGWNGLMISALARGGAALGESRWLNAAQRASAFVQSALADFFQGTLYRSWRNGRESGGAFAEDYAYVIQGLIDLYEADGDAAWVAWAARLQATMDEVFLDADAGGYFNSAAGRMDVLLRMKEDYDGAEPSATSVAAMNLARLGGILDDDSLTARARATIRAFGAQLSRAPSALPLMLCAWRDLEKPGVHLALSGPPGSSLARAVHSVYAPGRTLVHAASAGDLPTTAERAKFLESLEPADHMPQAYVCRGTACELPVHRPEEVAALLRRR